MPLTPLLALKKTVLSFPSTNKKTFDFSVEGFFLVSRKTYSATIASVGQAPAQVPQSMHLSGSIT